LVGFDLDFSEEELFSRRDSLVPAGRPMISMSRSAARLSFVTWRYCRNGVVCLKAPELFLSPLGKRLARNLRIRAFFKNASSMA
jgi:hypothetical protein